MNASAIRSFVERRWDLVDRAKLRARAERYRREGPEGCLRAAAELRGRWQRLHPEGSSSAARSEDLRHHIELSTKLAKLGDVARGR